MSFSTNVKNELIGTMPRALHCRQAELAAMLSLAGGSLNDGSLYIKSESIAVAERARALVKKIITDSTPGDIVSQKKSGKTTWSFSLNMADSLMLRMQLRLDEGLIPQDMLKRAECCKKSFLKGAFLASGSITDPQKEYHLEFITSDELRSQILSDIISVFGIDAKTVRRKKYSVVYLKDGESISDVLRVLEAPVSMMELENVRIVKEVRNDTNRRLNCDSANIDKTIRAAGRQIADIQFILDTIGSDALSEDLRATALIRLENPECSLTELGRLHKKPVGRSGVNHRLQKLSEMAEKLRSGRPINE